MVGPDSEATSTVSSSAQIVPTSTASSIQPSKTKSYVSPSRGSTSGSRNPSSGSRNQKAGSSSRSSYGKYSSIRNSKSSLASTSSSTSGSGFPRSALFQKTDTSSSSPTPVLSSSTIPEKSSAQVVEASSSLIPSIVEQTLLKTFYTSLTYFTTLFNGIDASTKTRTEVITNVVPTVTRSTVFLENTPVPSDGILEVEPTALPGKIEEAENDDDEVKPNIMETTFYTTYTYLSSIYKGGTMTLKSSLDTYTNVVADGSTIRSGLVKKSSVINNNIPIEPTKVEGRTAASKKPSTSSPVQENNDEDDDDLNEVGSNVNELSETTIDPPITTVETPKDANSNLYELEGSEMTTEKSVYNEHEHFGDDEKDTTVEDENELVQATPVLKTYFTTFTFFTSK